MPSDLQLLDVITPQHVEQLRVIRNDCRLFMTRDRQEISPEQQARWFAALDHTRVHPYLLSPAETAPQFLGYGLIRRESATLLLSGGLLEKFRGQGVGAQLFALLVAEAYALGGGPIELEVLQSNARARAVYEKLGFQALGREGDVVRMRLT